MKNFGSAESFRGFRKIENDADFQSARQQAARLRYKTNYFSLPLQVVILSFLLFAVPAFADHFGDIDITAITLANGNTYHGYHEFRFLIENHSTKNGRKVTLLMPDRAYPSGNSVSRLSRTVTVGADSRMLVPLWQPPLAMSGNNQIRVLIDDDEAGVMNMPDPSRHLTMASYPGRYGGYSGSGATETAILVSRSLNFDEMNHAFNAKTSAGDYSAQMATGAPDSSARSGVTTAWMPAPGAPGPHWLEVDYSPPQTAQGVRVYFTSQIPGGMEVSIRGVSGTNLYHTNLPSARTGRFGNIEVPFPQTTENVKTVRLEFGRTTGSFNISVDAVELMGASNSVWATSARASSEATGSFGPSMSSGTPTRTLLRSELPIAEWSEAWLSYTPYDAVALTATDLRTLPPAAFSALWSYVECGGNVVVFGGTEVPEPWRAFAKTNFDQGEMRHIGFGRCFAFEDGQISALSSSNIKRLIEAVDSSGRIWESLPSLDQANHDFPVVDNYHVPVHGTVFIMLLFVIAIGPVNLIVLSRMNRRTWLLWTIPAISFLTCLMVFAYSYIREGVTPDTRISGITLLDQANKRATTVGMTAFYCPLTPSQGLFFSSETEATPLVERVNYGRGTGHEVDWSQAQHFGRGWVSARVPAHFYLRKSETRRERLEIETQSGQTMVVNGLGATIKNLWLADGSSHVFMATNIPAGQKILLAASTQVLQKDEQLGPKGVLDGCGAAASITDGTPFLRPNTYVAELDANPFIENGLGVKAQSARTKSHAVVYGTLESPAKQ